MACCNLLKWREGEVLWSIYPLESFFWPSIYFSCTTKLCEAGIPPRGMNIEYEGVIEGDSSPVLVQYRGRWLVRPLSLVKSVCKFKVDEKEVARMLKHTDKVGNSGFRTGVLDKEPQEVRDTDISVNGKMPGELKTAVSIAFLLTSALEIRECMHERGLEEQDIYWVTTARVMAADQTVEELMKFLSEVSKATDGARALKSPTLPPLPQVKRASARPQRKRIRKEPPSLDGYYAVSGVLPRKQKSKKPSSEEAHTGVVTPTYGINPDSPATRPLSLSEMLAMKRLQAGLAVLEVRHETLVGNRVLMLDLLQDGVAALNGEKDADLDRLMVCVDTYYPPPLLFR